MRVLVTGSSGMIGWHVVEECRGRGWEVTQWDLRESDPRDVAERGSYDDPRFGTADLIVHLAAEPFIPDGDSSPEKMARTNILGTRLLLEKVRPYQRCVFVSSSEVYGGDLRRPLIETDPIQPHSFYAMTKAAGEQLAALAVHGGKNVVIFRPFNCYGPHCAQPYVIPTIITQIYRDKKVTLGRLDTCRDLSFVADTARAIVELAMSQASGTIHFGSGTTRTIREIVGDVWQAMRDTGLTTLERLSVTGNQEERLRPWDVEHLQSDSGAFHSVVKPWPKTSWEEGLRRTVAWFKNIGCRWPWDQQ